MSLHNSKQKFCIFYASSTASNVSTAKILVVLIIIMNELGQIDFLKGIFILDPMMMALGAMVTMAGAYMAIVMQEQAAANAFALAAASGKKKK